MEKDNGSNIDLNNSLNYKGINTKTSLGYFPLLKFKENLYTSCQSKYSEFINNRKNDIKLVIDNKTKQQVTLDDYLSNSDFNILTPIPFINKRKIKNNLENKELNNFQRNAVLMRRIEYSNKIKQNKMKKKYNKHTNKIIYIQKILKGYLVRKVINQVNIIKNSLSNFIFLINICITKKYYDIFKKNINEINKNTNNEIINKNENIENRNSNSNINGGEEITVKNDSHNQILEKYINIKQDKEDKEKVNNDNNNIEEKNFKDHNIFVHNSNENNNKQSMVDIIDKIEKLNSLVNISKTEKINNSKNKHVNKINPNSNKTKEINPDSIIENDYYMDFSNKDSHQILSKLSKSNGNKNSKKNIPNRNPKNDLLNYYLSDVSSSLAIKKTKTETIQRQFRKYLSNKGYYGIFDKRKIAIIYLIKNMIIYNIRPYILNILKLNYKKIKIITVTQEENFINITSERINNINIIYNAAKKEIK